MKRVWSYIALVLALAEVVLIFLSWLLSAALPNSGVRSMLSGEGLRWFMGHFGNILATPLLSWLLLMVIAVGCLMRSGVFSRSTPSSYRERRALLMGGSVLCICVAVLLSLTMIPHAALLSATGSLFPSPFSYSLIPFASYAICAFSIVYGVVAGTYQSLTDVYDSLLYGIRKAAPLFFFYILLTQFYESLMFVFH